MSPETISIFGVWSDSALINSEKLITELTSPHFTKFGRLQIQF
jgi:hypothetical protein